MIKINIQKSLKGADGPMLLNLNLQVENGQLITLFGASGAGKTSTLKILAGLLLPESGNIIVNGQIWFDSDQKINLKPQLRNIGYVFQDYALFPNMTVLENLQFAAAKKQQAIITELISIFELDNLQNRKPNTLSGGQQQRLALARALVQQPNILLLDEPLAALDVKIRLKLQDYIAKVHRQFELTTFLISHDIGEIHKLADWVFELDKGQIVRQGKPSEIFTNQKVSGKFKFTGEILHIEKQEVVYIVTVLIQNEIVKVIALEQEIANLEVGDKIIVASKAFNPVLYKVF